MDRTSTWLAHPWTSAFGVALAFGLLRCSVYDPSLLTDSERSPVSQAGSDSDAGSGSKAGTSDGDAGDAANGGTNAAGGALSFAGTVGTAGDGTGGTAGSASADAGATGQLASGGTSGASGSAGSGGSAPVLHELAVGKPVTVSSQETAHPGAHGNDGNASSRWAASSSAMPQWWQVDLGASHPLEQLALRFEYSDRTYSYIVETSSNGAVYTQQAMVNGIGAVQMVDLTGRPNARYVRITVTKAVSPKVGETPFASFWEASLLGL